jgi:hypothetical protein
MTNTRDAASPTLRNNMLNDPSVPLVTNRSTRPSRSLALCGRFGILEGIRGDKSGKLRSGHHEWVALKNAQKRIDLIGR